MKVEWTLNGLSIPNYLEVSMPNIGKRIHVLSIDSVKADHAGNYSCIATNQAGTAEFTAPLVVIGLFAICFRLSLLHLFFTVIRVESVTWNVSTTILIINIQLDHLIKFKLRD